MISVHQTDWKNVHEMLIIVVYYSTVIANNFKLSIIALFF